MLAILLLVEGSIAYMLALNIDTSQLERWILFIEIGRPTDTQRGFLRFTPFVQTIPAVADPHRKR